MSASSTEHPRAAVAWRVLRILLALEALFLVWVLGFAVVAALGDGSAMDSLALVVMAALILVWSLVTCIGAMRSRAGRARASALTLHVLLFAAGTGCLQIGIGPWWLGWAMVAVALLGFAAALLAVPEAREAEPGAEAPGGGE